MEKTHVAARMFFAAAEIAAVRPYGTGKVNDTFLVSLNGEDKQSYLLQRISSRVFPRPEWVMENLRVVCDHVAAKGEALPGRRWEMPLLRQTLSGRDFWRDPEGGCWRVLHFIKDSRCFEELDSVERAHEVGFALGRFHRLINDLDPRRLHDTLPGFHVAPLYLARYDLVRAAGRGEDSIGSRFCRDFINQRREAIAVLEKAADQGKLLVRPIHGDPKLSNILFDGKSGQAVSLIDLDTVRPGLLLYDIGDCLRSSCNTSGEESAASDLVFFDVDLCRAILRGYAAEAGRLLTTGDVHFLADAVKLIALELGMRFFTDHLEGDIYFKTAFPGQNLQRALVQFRLVASIEKQQKKIIAILAEMSNLF